MFDVVRGKDSTGVARVLGDGSVEVYKKAIPSYDFLETAMGKEALSFSEAYINAMIGHNRAATVGKVNSDNAHPFQHNHITLAHNGTLTYRGNLKNKCTTDSEEICKELAEVKDTVSVLEKLEGAFALTWYNAEDDTINLARNNERPLWIAKMKDNDGILWASEQWMLIGAVSEPFKQPLRIEDPWRLEAGQWWSLNLASGKPHVKPFRPAEKTYSSYNYGYNSGKYGSRNASASKCVGAGTINKLGVASGVKVLVSVDKAILQNIGERVVSTTLDVPIISRAANYHKAKARIYAANVEKIRENVKEGVEIFSCKVTSDNYQHTNTITCTDLLPVCSAERYAQDKFPKELDGVKLAQEEQGSKKSKESSAAGPALPAPEPSSSKDDSVEKDDSDLPFEFYDHRGNLMEEDEFHKEVKKDCPYCGDPLVDSGPEEVVWLGSELAHSECAADWQELEDLEVMRHGITTDNVH